MKAKSVNEISNFYRSGETKKSMNLGKYSPLTIVKTLDNAIVELSKYGIASHWNSHLIEEFSWNINITGEKIEYKNGKSNIFHIVLENKMGESNERQSFNNRSLYFAFSPIIVDIFEKRWPSYEIQNDPLGDWVIASSYPDGFKAWFYKSFNEALTQLLKIEYLENTVEDWYSIMKKIIEKIEAS